MIERVAWSLDRCFESIEDFRQAVVGRGSGGAG
jgi:hypothetical protein